MYWILFPSSYLHGISSFTVRPQLSITSFTANGPNALTEEDSLVLSCTAADYYPRTRITWFKGANTLSATSRIDISDVSVNLDSGLYRTESNVTIASTLTTDSGAYYCKAILRVDGLDQPLTVRVDGNISVSVQGTMKEEYCFFDGH